MTNGPQTPQIRIIGAGAMGLGTGYHLQLAGAAITFLVRPARMLEMSRPQVLYSYDDATLKTFAGKAAQAATTADGLLEIWSSLEHEALPLDFAAFNKFHHGGKVRAQDIELLKDCVKLGEQEGQPMSALKELLDSVQTRAQAEQDVLHRRRYECLERHALELTVRGDCDQAL
jgi:glycine/D-amino acid oxidase-like deaminating enzyme